MLRYHSRVALSGALLLAACGGTEPTPPPPELAGKIVFASDRSGTTFLYTMNPDGSDVRAMPIPIPGPMGAPDIAASGPELAFARETIYLVSADGTNLRHPIAGPGGRPRWSPTGQSIAFHLNQGSGYDVWLMNADGSGQRPITVSPGVHEYLGGWAPDGASLLVSRQPVDLSVPAQIWIMRADGTNAVQLTPNAPGGGYWPQFSPDGQWIAYVADGEVSGYDLRLMRPDGSDNHLVLAAPDSGAGEPSWSPDGQLITFNWSVNIAAIRPDGTDLHVLATGGLNHAAVWGPALAK